MKDFIFSLGIIDKKLIWPFLYSTIQIIESIIDTYYPKDKKSSMIGTLVNGIGGCFTILIPYVLGYNNQNQQKGKKEKKCTKPNVLHYFLLILFNGIYIGIIT